MEDSKFFREKRRSSFATFFRALAMFTGGASVVSLMMYGGVWSIEEFDGIAVLHPFLIYEVEVTRETQAEIAGNYLKITAISFVLTLVFAGLAKHQSSGWRGTRKTESVRDR